MVKEGNCNISLEIFMRGTRFSVATANVKGYISVPFLFVLFKTERLQLLVENETVNMRMRTTRSTH